MIHMGRIRNLRTSGHLRRAGGLGCDLKVTIKGFSECIAAWEQGGAQPECCPSEYQCGIRKTTINCF